MSVLRSQSRGDMYVELSVETPVNLSKKQKELLTQFEAEGKKHGNHSPQSEGFFARVKEFFDSSKD
jgi:molecular chaperone DnaJ